MVAFLLYAAFMYAVLVRLVRQGRPFRSLIATLMVGMVPYLLAALWERRNVVALMDPRHQAWSLIFGDLLLVPATVTLCAILWPRLPQERTWYQFARNRGWPLAAAAVSAAGTIWFRIHEAAAYDPLRYYSIGKLVHDLIGYPAILAILAFAVPPVLTAARHDKRRSTMWLRLTIGLMMAVFIALLIHDFSGLSPAFLHVQDDWNNYALPVRCRTGL
jgi:hypothetical protein